MWTPSEIKIGDVGYHKRPHGSFVRLFNAFDPVGTATAHGKPLPPLTHVLTGTQTDERRTVLQRGIDWFGGFLRSPIPKNSNEDSDPVERPREVSRKYDFVLHAKHKRAIVVAESTIYVCTLFFTRCAEGRYFGDHGLICALWQ